MQLSALEPLDGVPRNIKDAVLALEGRRGCLRSRSAQRHWPWGLDGGEGEQCLYLLGHLPHGPDTCPIEVVVVLAGFNEPVILDVFLHLFSRHHKVVISPIHLIISFRSGGIFTKRERERKRE